MVVKISCLTVSKFQPSNILNFLILNFQMAIKTQNANIYQYAKLQLNGFGDFKMATVRHHRFSKFQIFGC